MAITPELNEIGIESEVEFVSYPTNTFFLDKTSMQLRNFVDLLPAMVQAVEIVLSVERFKFQIYTKNFGFESDGLIGQDYGFVVSEIKRRVLEALSMDDRILKVDDFNFRASDGMSTVTTTFMVYTVYGNFETDLEVNLQ